MKFRAFAAALLAALGLLFVASAAAAQSITFRFQNEHSNIVDVELYSQDRDYIWPGGNKVFSLNDGRPVDMPIACRRGETVCYGAWVRNTASSQWGAGRGGKKDCKSCCYVCNGGETPILVLD